MYRYSTFTYGPQDWAFDTYNDGQVISYYINAYYQCFLLLMGNNQVRAERRNCREGAVRCMDGSCYSLRGARNDTRNRHFNQWDQRPEAQAIAIRCRGRFSCGLHLSLNHAQGRRSFFPSFWKEGVACGSKGRCVRIVARRTLV